MSEEELKPASADVAAVMDLQDDFIAQCGALLERGNSLVEVVCTAFEVGAYMALLRPQYARRWRECHAALVNIHGMATMEQRETGVEALLDRHPLRGAPGSPL